MDKISFRDQYQKINDAALKVFFDGRYADVPVYLDLEDESLKEIAEILEKDESQVEEYICKVVSFTLEPHKNNPYEWHTQKYKVWKNKGGRNDPPFLGLLIVFSLAAEHMRSEGSYSSSNYYVRLAEILSYNPELQQSNLSQAGRYTLDFWLGLNAWLRRYDNDLGVPTASAVHESWKYVSYAISQSLVRDGDKKQMHKMFQLYRLSPNQVMTSSEMSFYIDEWLSGHNAPAWLSRLWKNADLREKVAASAADELQNWRGSSDKEDNQPDNLRFHWLATKKTFPKKRFQLYVTVSGAEHFNSLTLKTDTAEFDVHVENLVGTEERFLNVAGNLSIQALLGQNIEVTGDQDTTGLFMAKPIISLCKADDGNYFKEVSRVRSLRPHVILCHQAWKERVVRHLDAYALKGYTSYESDESIGIPKEWCCFSDVVFDGSIEASDIQDNQLQQLVPFSEVPAVQALGGIKLGHGIWHGHEFPSIILPTVLKGKDTVKVSVSDGHSFEPKIKAEILVKDFNSRYLAETIDLPDFGEVVVSAGSKVKELHLGVRTANNARKRMLQKLPELCWDFGNSSVFVTPSDRDQEENEIEGISNISNLGIVDNSSTLLVSQAPELVLANSETDSYQPLISGGEYEAAACILRGYHHWISVSEEPDSRMMICKDCSSRIIVPPPPRWKKLKANDDPHLKIKKSKLVVSEANIDKPHIDDVVDAICFKLGGSWPLLQSYLSLIADLPNDVGEFARRLSDLCIVDLKRDIGSGSVKSWVVPPPALSFDNESNSLMLTGFRSKKLISDITSSLCDVAKYKTHYDDEASVTIHVWELVGVSVEDVRNLVSEIKDPLGRGVDVADFVPLRLLSNLPSISTVVELLPDYHVDTASEREYFDVLRGKWVEPSTHINTAGAYRVKNRGNMYFYVGPDGASKRSSYDLVKLFSARLHNRYLHSYDSNKKELKCVLGADLPPLLSRAVVLSSRELPYVSNGLLIYPNVPEYIGKLVVSILYT